MKLPASILLVVTAVSLGHTSEPGEWEKLPSLPEKLGVAGSFAGISSGALLVAGGANFPDKMPWEGGRKVWHEQVWILEKPGGQWSNGGSLPHRLAYGVSFPSSEGVLCAGGSDALRHYADCFRLSWDPRKRAVVTSPFPRLPQPIANACGATLGQRFYIAGGIASPDATNALNAIYRFDPGSTQGGWQSLPAWPGPARMLAVAGAHDGSFYLFGGTALKPGPDGKPIREGLRDAYCYTPGKGWKRLADLPRVAVAAPSPAPVVNGRLLIIGGDDGTQANRPPAGHHGFCRDVLAYDPVQEQWASLAEAPFSLVTTMVVAWEKRLVIPGGEARPGVRSPEVWAINGVAP